MAETNYTNSQVISNIRGSINALEAEIEKLIDDQSEGISYQARKLQADTISATQKMISETENLLKSNITAVYSKASETNQNVNQLTDYVMNEQKDQLYTIENSINQISHDNFQGVQNLEKSINQVAEGIGQAQDDINSTIKSELKISSLMLENSISDYDRAVIERFENVSGLINNSAKSTTRKIEEVSTEISTTTKLAAAGLKKDVNSMVDGATDAITTKIIEVDEKRNEDNWGIFEGIKQWIEGLFSFSPEQIATTIMSLTDIASLVGGKLKNKDTGK